MVDKKRRPTTNTAYPLTLSVAMIVAAIVLSFVDLAFLNEVIGKILDIGATESMLIAFALGLIGIALMAHQGIRQAHGESKFSAAIAHYLLWIALGFAFVLIRLFSASILGLSVSGDEKIVNILGVAVREVDLVISPLMLILYFATGILSKDGFKNLFSNPDFGDWLKAIKDKNAAQKSRERQLKEQAEAEIEKARREAEERLGSQMELTAAGAKKEKLTKEYIRALQLYRTKEAEIKEKYQRISSNISYIKSIDKQELEFETKVKPGLNNIVQESVYSVQNNIALAIRKKTGANITELRSVIDSYNRDRHELNR